MKYIFNLLFLFAAFISLAQPVVYYPFNGNANDESINGNDGTVNGATLTTDRFGNANSAYSFDGNDLISVVEDLSETSYAVSFWFKTTIGDQGIYSYVNPGTRNDRNLYLTGGNIYARLWGPTEIINSSSLSLNDDLWHHVVHTFGGSVGAQRIYIDGELVATGTSSASGEDRNTTVYIGNNYNSPFTGDIDDIRIYNVALDAEEVEQLFQENTGFITTWETTDGEITIPTTGTGYDYNIFWKNLTNNGVGDGSITNQTGDYTITGLENGSMYQVEVTGDFPSIYFNNGSEGQNVLKIQSIEQWGNISWTSMQSAFWGCQNLDVSVTAGIPDLTSVSNINSMFNGCSNFNTNINDWDVSSVTEMSATFNTASIFNQPLNDWDVSNVTTIRGLFANASAFNQPLNNWDVSSIQDMSLGFRQATAFDQDLGDWDISSLTDMDQFLNSTGLSIENYDASLQGWASLDVGETQIPIGVPLRANGVEYCEGVLARDDLINTYGWTITDAGQNCTDLVAYYLFNNNANDESGNGNDGTVNGAALTTDRFGNADAAYNFDGTNDFIVVADDASFSTGTHTVSAWVRSVQESVSPLDIIVGYTNGSATDGYYLNVGGSNSKFEFTQAFDFATNSVQSDELYAGDNLWHQVVGVRDGTTSVMYIDGVLQTNTISESPSLADGSYALTIGGVDGILYFEGDIDDVRLYNRALSANEVLDLYNENNWLQESPTSFITTWETTGSFESITIPTFTGETYNYTVDWGDGTVESVSTDVSPSHTYTVAGTYSVAITGTFPRIYFNSTGDKDKILTVEQWGDIAWTSMNNAFAGCSNLDVTATDAPDLTGVLNMNDMFLNATSFNGAIGHWDMSGVTSIRSMFLGATSFNQPLNTWNLQSNENIQGLFNGASSFNQPLDNWNVSNVIFMGGAFSGSAFNRPIDNWNVSSAQFMNGMFSTSAFNQPLPSWDVSGVSEFQDMFANTAFDQSLASWDISSASNMSTMFNNSGMSTDNYDVTLQGWATLDAGETQIPEDISLGASGLDYCGGESARNELINTYFWTIAGDTKECTLADGLVAYYSFDGNANDESGNGNNGTVNGATLTSDRFGNADAAYSFGIISNITIPVDLDNQINSGFTVSIWINADDFASVTDQYIISQYSGGGNGWGLYIDQEGGGRLRYFGDNAANDGDPSVPYSNLNTESWLHITSVSEGTVRRLFINGVLIESFDNTWNASSESQVIIGDKDGTNDALIGSMDDIQIYNRALSGSEIQDLYTENNWLQESPSSFKTTWQTTTANESITIPTFNGETYDYIIDWGDGAVENITTDASPSHMYATAGTHTIAISGTFPRIYFNNTGDKDKILTVEQWGGIQWTSMENAFYGCVNLLTEASDAPILSQVTSLERGFNGCRQFNSDLSNWDVSNIQNFGDAFFNAIAFNGDVTTWNTSSATNLGGMFFFCRAFNQDISSWNTANVTRFVQMFDGASVFDQNLGTWNLSGLTNATFMFNGSGMSTANYDLTLQRWASLDAGEALVPTNVNLGANGLTYCVGENARGELINTYNWTITGDDKVCTINDGLVAQYNFNNNANDESGNGNDGTSNGATATSDRFGNVNAAYSFDGADDFVDMGTPTFDFSSGLTFNVWANVDMLQSWMRFIEFSNGEGDESILFGNQGTSDEVIYQVYNNEILDASIASSSIEIGKWNQYTVTHGTDESVKIYKDGVEIVSGTGSLPETVGRSQHYLGRSSFAADDFYAGKLDDIRIYNRALSASGIQDLYTENNWLQESPSSFITTWETTTASESITIPTFTGETYDYSVDWGDGTVESITTDAAPSHTYTDAGTYSVAISGTFPRIYFNNAGDKEKIQDVNQWGSVSWTSMESAFAGCTNLNFTASDAPDLSNVLSTVSMFSGATSFDSDISNWDVDNVTDMGGMFFGAFAFNQNIGNWDVSAVTNMSNMFNGASSFNQDVSSWVVGQVTNMAGMFSGTAFNQDISEWDVSAVRDMSLMFQSAASFNQNLGSWDISGVVADGGATSFSMSQMFENSGMSTNNYDLTLRGWATLDAGETQIPTGITLGASGLSYCGGEAARDELINTYSWTISGDTKECALTDGLVAYLPFTNGSLLDESGNENSASPESSSSQSIQTISDRFGNETDALSFNKVDLQLNASVASGTYDNGVTANFWIEPGLVDDNEDDLYEVFAYLGNTSLLISEEGELAIATTLDTEIFSTESGILNDNQWQMISCTIDMEDNLSFFFNGVQVLTDQLVMFDQTDGSFYLAPSDNSSMQRYSGSIDDVRLYDRVLTSSEIQEIYNAERPPLNTETEITEFTISGQVRSEIIGDESKIIVMMPNGTDLTNLKPEITYSQGASVSPDTTETQDFTNSVTYTVTAEDGVLVTAWEVFVYEQPVVPDGLIAYYPFNFGTVLDESGNKNDGSLNGPSTIPDRFGSSMSAFSFDGTNDYISGEIDAHPLGNVSISYSLWYKFSELTDPMSMIHVGGSEIGEQSFILINPSGQFDYEIGGSNFAFNIPNISDTWRHFVVTKEGNQVIFYLNGSLLVSGEISDPDVQNVMSSDFKIGANSGLNELFKGDLDDIRIYDRTLSSSEIQEIYDAEKAVSSEAFITSFTIPNQVGQSAIDSESGTVEVVMPAGTDVTGLTPIIEISAGATVTPESGLAQDFTNAATYTVTAEDGTTTKAYEVTVTTIGQGLIAYYTFSGDGTDKSGNDYDMIPQNNTALAEDRLGEAEMAYSFDGDADYLQNFDDSFDIPEVFTVLAWINPSEAASDFRNIVTQHPNDDDPNYLQFAVETDASLGVYFDGTAGSSVGEKSGVGSIDYDQWQHVAVSFDGSKITLFKNGAIIQQNDVTWLGRPTSNGKTPVTIGALAQGSGSFFGDIDEVRVYNDALSLTEVRAIYLDEVPESPALITSYSFTEQTGPATIGDGTVTVEVANGTDLTNLVASFALSPDASATISGTAQQSGVTSNDFSNPVTYMVTAADGITNREWVVTVLEASEDATEVLAFSFNEETGPATIGSGMIDIEVAFGTDVSDLVATFNLSTGASATAGGAAQESGVTANDFTNPVTYTVTAADEVTTQEWVVNITIATNTSTEIVVYSFEKETTPATVGDGTIDIEVTFGTDVSDLIATFDLSTGASAAVGGVTQESGVTANDFTNPVTYTVTAADEVTTQEWVVNVTIATNTSTEIVAYSLEEETGPATVGDGTIDIEVTFGTDVSDLIATFDLSTGASAAVGGVTQESGVTANDFSSPVSYTVTAEDNVTTQDWIVNVAIAANDSTDILAFSINEVVGVINAEDHTVSLTMPSGTDLSFLTPTIEISTNAQIGPASGAGQNFSSPVTYTVVAEDLSSQAWVISVTVDGIPPESIFLSNSTITAGPTGKIVGDIGIVDEDNVLGDYDLAVISGTDNFEITANRLVTKEALTEGSYSVTIEASGPDTIQETFSISVIDASEIQNIFIQIINSLGKGADSYRIIGVPVASAGVSDVFTSPNASDLGRDGTWRLLNYSGGGNRDLSSGSSLQAGSGYWFITTLDPDVMLPDNAAPAPVNSAGEFELILNEGWNLVGNPFNASFNWDDVINYNILQQYIQAGDVQADFFKWKPNTSTEVGYINETNVNVFEGGWVNAAIATTIYIPNSTAAISGRVSSREVSSGYFNNVFDWELIVDVIGDKYYSSLSGVSFNESAKTGQDRLDREAPPSIDASIKLNLLDAESGMAINRVPHTTDYTWDFNLDVGDERNARLAWDPSLASMIDQPLYLIIPEAGEIIDMALQNEVSVSDGVSHVQVHYGENPPLPGMVNVLAAYPNPSDDLVFVQVITHESLYNKSAMIQLYDEQGRVVKRLDGLAVTARGNEFKLDLDQVSSGIYVLQVLIDNQKSKNIKIQKR